MKSVGTGNRYAVFRRIFCWKLQQKSVKPEDAVGSSVEVPPTAVESPSAGMGSAAPLQAPPSGEFGGQPEAGSVEARKVAISFFEDIILLEKELDDFKQQAETPAGPLVEHVLFRLEEIMERHGAVPVGEEPQFNGLWHQAVPPEYVPDGTAIEETISPGWRFGTRILRRARVRIRRE